jgi:hypothetical protein
MWAMAFDIANIEKISRLLVFEAKAHFESASSQFFKWTPAGEL